jgi:hypothetical protein
VAGPIASAFIVTAAMNGRLGIEEPRDRTGRRDGGRIWFVLAMPRHFAMFVLCAAIAAIFRIP